MADYINNEAAGDKYTPACTLGPNFEAKSLVVTIANNPALMQFALGRQGSWRWTDEREYFSIPQSFSVGNVVGVRVRNANPGQTARVLATLGGNDDPDFQSGMPFVGLLQPNGTIVSASVRAEDIIAGGSQALTGAFTVFAGATLNISIVGNNATFVFVAHFDLGAGGVTGNGPMQGALFLDGGLVSAAVASLTDINANIDGTIAQVGGGNLAAGAHTFDLRVRKLGGGGNGACNGCAAALVIVDQ